MQISDSISFRKTQVEKLLLAPQNLILESKIFETATQAEREKKMKKKKNKKTARSFKFATEVGTLETT